MEVRPPSGGSPADPPAYRSTALAWRQGDTIPLTAEWTLRVLGHPRTPALALAGVWLFVAAAVAASAAAISSCTSSETV